MAEDFSDLKSLAELAVEYLNLLVDTTKDLITAQKETNEEIKKNTAATQESTKEKKKETDETKKSSQALKDLKDKSLSLGKELLNIANAGVKFGTAVGTTATRGVQLEIQNRLAVASQLANFNANLAVTVEQLKAAQTGFSDVFIGAAAGMQLSSKGSVEFVRNLKEGFGAEFEPTAETFRTLTQLGISTTEQFNALRVASGRAGLSANQLSTLYNKNQLSFLLYGNSFAKAAVQAERLGVNLASIQAAQEGLVTNLDGTIDTVAQINQLGGQIDFGNLVRVAEQEGPDALMAYVRATVPANLMQSASTRALFKQLGISVEDYIKSGGEQVSAADAIEAKMTEAADKTSAATKFIAGLGSAASKLSAILTGSFGSLAMAAFAAAAALIKVAGAGGLKGMMSPGGFKTLGVGGSIAAGAAGVGTGMAVGTALGGGGTGSLIGSIIGTGLGAFFGPGGMMIGGTLGGALGGQIQNMMATPANDMYSAGYGSRVLVTPKGAFALNNADDIIAGTNLFPKGSLRAGSDNSDLVRKVDNLITALSNATTTINVGGNMQTVPRLQLVGVYSRNEVR
jgi:hypothetical protein